VTGPKATRPKARDGRPEATSPRSERGIALDDVRFDEDEQGSEFSADPQGLNAETLLTPLAKRPFLVRPSSPRVARLWRSCRHPICRARIRGDGGVATQAHAIFLGWIPLRRGGARVLGPGSLAAWAHLRRSAAVPRPGYFKETA